MTKKRHCRIDDVCAALLIGAIAFPMTSCGRTTAGTIQPQPPEVEVVTVEQRDTRLLVRMREDDLRLEGMQTEMQLRLDRIEARLNLSEA